MEAEAAEPKLVPPLYFLRQLWGAARPLLRLLPGVVTIGLDVRKLSL